MNMFKDKYSVLYKITTWLLGAIALGGGSWLLFPGAYKLGMWFGNDVTHWGIQDIHNGPQGWALGIGLLLIPVAFYFLAGWIGSEILSLFEN